MTQLTENTQATIRFYQERLAKVEAEHMMDLKVIEIMQEENEKYRRALSQIAHGDTWTAYPHDIAAWALGLKHGGGD